MNLARKNSVNVTGASVKKSLQTRELGGIQLCLFRYGDGSAKLAFFVGRRLPLEICSVRYADFYGSVMINVLFSFSQEKVSLSPVTCSTS